MGAARIGNFTSRLLIQYEKKGVFLISNGIPAGTIQDLPKLCSHLTSWRGCSYSSQEKTRSYWQYLKRKVLKPPTPPYHHVCQVGDPMLRAQAAPVDPAHITTAEIQTLIRTLVKVMRRTECVGLSAPQVGVPLQVLVMEFTEDMYNQNDPSLREVRELASFSLKIFINPTMRVLDSSTVSFPEGCESISGFSAVVPRYRAVAISGLNEKGEATSWQARGWPARIIQHEMDHLQGHLYIDKMDSRSLVNTRWMELNE